MRSHSIGVLPKALLHSTLLMITGFGLVSCTDPVSPKVTPGSYEATSLTRTRDGDTADMLMAGVTIWIVLSAEGTTTGELNFPPGVTGGERLIIPLDGTWTQTGGTVNFDHDSDTFIRDMAFAVRGSTLVGDRVFDGTRVRVTLTRVNSEN
jgi:hypothetical protein